MDIYNLINSKAISEHCRKIGHQFNTEELAVLVFRNRSMSVEEKIKLYEELISDYPDMEVIERINCKHYDSVKTMIRDEINRLQDLIKNIETEDKDAVYTYSAVYKSTKREYSYDLFENLSKTINDVKHKVNEYIEEYDDICTYNIVKKFLADEKVEITAEYVVKDKKSILVNLYASNNGYLDIDNIFLNIPNPFKRGDILISSSRSPFCSGTISPYMGYPFVLTWLCTERENLSDLMAEGNFDSSDMQGTGYYIHENRIDHDNHFNYDSWEYFDGELTGMERILKGVSNLMKDEIEIKLFINAYEKMKMQEDGKYLLNSFTDEGIELAGFSKNEIKDIKNIIKGI